MANKTLAKSLLNGTGCYSLVGPARAINFDDAAAFWVAFYHLMFKLNTRGMKHSDLEFYVKTLSKLYGEPINYFRRDAKKAERFQPRQEPRRSPIGWRDLRPRCRSSSACPIDACHRGRRWRPRCFRDGMRCQSWPSGLLADDKFVSGRLVAVPLWLIVLRCALAGRSADRPAVCVGDAAVAASDGRS